MEIIEIHRVGDALRLRKHVDRTNKDRATDKTQDNTIYFTMPMNIGIMMEIRIKMTMKIG